MGKSCRLENPAKLPDSNKLAEVREPIIEANILVPQDYVGAVIGLCEEKRGSQIGPALHGWPGDASITSCRCLKSCWTSLIVSNR